MSDDKAVTLRMPVRLWDAMAAVAEQERRSTTAQIVKALEEWLDERQPSLKGAETLEGGK